ncbi:hypothetical protein NDU88_005820 [Pleurodeles waltl]|uniref:Uncharacterized protein n=1 Tax=Pleurodeles waltl TaxID=8319 RepID=A0AAV7PGN8_PLEWA|nr:hypothetical protein NDU88_005820 [Pleurodeles waltl]
MNWETECGLGVFLARLSGLWVPVLPYAFMGIIGSGRSGARFYHPYVAVAWSLLPYSWAVHVVSQLLGFRNGAIKDAYEGNALC